MTKYDDMAFFSNFGYERVESKGQIPVSGTMWSFNNFTIPHNLGYKPFFRLWITLGSSNAKFAIASGPDTYGVFGSASVQVEDVSADASNITVQLGEYGVGSYTGKIYYRIYAEPQL